MMKSYLKTLIITCLCAIATSWCLGQNVKTYDTSNSGLVDNDLRAVVVDNHGNNHSAL